MAYMTFAFMVLLLYVQFVISIQGILPIKKYGSHSALNMFTEYSMTNMGSMAEYFGFTENARESCWKIYGNMMKKR